MQKKDKCPFLRLLYSILCFLVLARMYATRAKQGHERSDANVQYTFGGQRSDVSL